MCKSELQRDFLIILCTVKPFFDFFFLELHITVSMKIYWRLLIHRKYAKRLSKAGLHSHVISPFFLDKYCHMCDF